MATQGEITRLLAALGGGDSEAMNQLLPLVYEQLRTIAHRKLRGRRPGQTLQTTALVHETYLRLAGGAQAEWRNRTHFLAVSAVAMRQILVDAARRRNAQKRGGDAFHEDIEDAVPRVEARAEEILAIDQALTRLTELQPRLGRTVELRFFGGLTEEEAAEALGVNRRTVQRDWKMAKAILHRELMDQGTLDAG